MDNKTLEQKILGYMLENPRNAKLLKLKHNWFINNDHKQLADILTNTEGVFADFSEIELEVRKIYPKTNVTEEWLHALKFEGTFVDSIKQSVKALEVAHVRNKTHQATVKYADYASDDNKEQLEDMLRKMSELEIDEDEGELKAPIDQLLYELDNEVELGVSSYKGLDAVLGAGLEGGIMFIIAARPGVGKSTFAINLIIEALIKNEGVKADFFSLEMTKIEVFKKFVSRMTRINSYKFKNAKVALNDDEKRDVIEKSDWLNSRGLRIHDSRYGISDIERMIRQRHHEAGDNKYIAVVDYVGLVNSENERLQRHQQLGKISRLLKRLTNELNIPILLLSQLSRGVEGRDSNVPILSDLRESGDLEQDANVVGFLSESDSSDDVVDLTIAKNRGGALSTIEYSFQKPESMFVELGQKEW